MQKKNVIVIGTGAGGAMAAKELQQKGHQVTILEAGGKFHPFAFPMGPMEQLKKTGLFLDERMIQLLFPAMRIRKTKDMVLVYGRGVGGTTTLATANAVRYDGPLQKLGIHLDEEFDELEQEVPITTTHQKTWNALTKELYHLFERQGLDPVITPKFLKEKSCVACGHCVLGCPHKAKWDTSELITEAIAAGAELKTNSKVTRLEVANGVVTKVEVQTPLGKKQYEADYVVLAAGGLGTPVILQNSGIKCASRLFVDPVLCVAAPYKNARMNHQISMPFISQQDGYILSPYMDYLSFFFHRSWKYPASDTISLMIKMADEEKGRITRKGIQKNLTANDQRCLQRAVDQCKDILKEVGVREEDIFLGTVNAGHPGGMLPLTRADAQTLHPSVLPENLSVADASLFPKSMGNPPILTIMAMAKRICKNI